MNEEDYQLCKALIIFKSVKNFLIDDIELFENFEKVIFENEVATNARTKECLNEYCDYIITPLK